MKWGALWVGAVVVVLWTSVGAAQTLAPDCAATEDTALLYRKAREYYDKEAFGESYYCCQQHWKLRPSYDVAANMGNLEVTRFAKYVEGARHLFYARQHLPSSLDESARKQVLARINDGLGEAMAHVATVRLSAWPRGAEVFVDDALVGTAPLDMPLFLAPGEHTLRLALAAHVEQRQVLDAKAGTDQTLELVLVPSGADGQASPAPADAPPAAPPPSPPTTAESQGGSVSPLVWIGFGVGAAGLIAGAVSGGIALARGSDIEGRCPAKRCDSTDAALGDEHDAALLSAHVSTASFALAGAGIVVGIIGLFVGGDAADGAEGRAWWPRVGPGGVSWEGSF